MRILFSILFSICLCQNSFADFNSGDYFGKGIIVQANGVTQTGGGRILNFASGTTVTTVNNAYQITASGGGGSGNIGIGTAGLVPVYVGVGTLGPSSSLYVIGNNVGIGSAAPGQALDVNGTVRAGAFIGTNASAVNTFAGNVGLGLTVPSYLLDVNGAARLNGVLNFVPSTASGLDGGSSAANSAGSTMTITSARGGVGGGTQEAGGALNLESGNGWSLNGSLTNAPVNIFAGQSDGIGTVQGWIDIHGASPFGGGYTNNENGGHVYIHGGDGYGGGAPGNGGNVFVSAGKGNGTSNVNGTVILGYSGIAESNTSVGDITNVSIGTKTATSQLTVAGAYTQTGSLANTITGTTSFSGSPSITTSGNVGIGSTAPGTALDVNGTIRATSYQNVFPSSSAGQILASPSANTPTWTSNILVSGTNTLFTAGNVGIGSSVPGTALDVIGTVRIGGGSGNQYLSGSGGNVGIGTTLSALNRLDIAGNASIGTAYAGYQSAPSNGLIVQGNVGIGSTTPQGGLVVTNGNVGIGTWSPIAALDIKTGVVAIGQSPVTIDTAGLQVVSAGNAIKIAGATSGNSTGSLQINGGYNNSVGLNVSQNSSTDLTTINAQPSDAAFAIQTHSINAIYINSTQNVGIGTGITNPISKLVIAGNVGIGTNSSSAFTNTTAPNGGMIVEGNVGLGSLAPGAALDVGGGSICLGHNCQSTWGSGAVSFVSYQPGLLSAVNATIGVNYKFSKTSTVDNLIGSAVTFSCVSNPTVTMYECGTSTTCSGPTTIGTVTVTAAGTLVVGTVNNSAITAGDYIGWAITAGTCASIDISATAQVHSN